jgi:hypothetical protein
MIQWEVLLAILAEMHFLSTTGQLVEWQILENTTDQITCSSIESKYGLVCLKQLWKSAALRVHIDI